ncbi:Hypothetical predicted protein [Marmota monax]|uniref:Uncharacterized protein n=1 Tax=Marmota monax TaxID=9995 RepID=A0A5E4C100_MARMO|nr:hypothetical protein GHT09_006605 [Marmota monax]VTJ75236.1 Hypothetical predicted protein [Marmota monax]
MKRSLRKMLRPGEKEPQDVVYQGVEDDMDESKDSFKVPWAIGSRDQLRSLGGDWLEFFLWAAFGYRDWKLPEWSGDACFRV